MSKISEKATEKGSPFFTKKHIMLLVDLKYNILQKKGYHVKQLL